jgi:uncharacterized membrane protein YeaQ/YmgE (transglycosylase-associated protein family)
MANEGLLITLIVGGVAGWLAGLVMRGTGFGVIGDVIVGLLGAVAGSWLLRAMHTSLGLGNPLLNEGAIAFIGAVVLLLVIGLLRPRRFAFRDRGWRGWR